MPIKLTEILIHIDWDTSHGELRMRYDKPIDSPYDLASLSRTIPRPDYLESDHVIPDSFFSRTGTFKVIPDVGRSGLYLLLLRPNYRLKNLIVDPEEIVVDVYANENDSITYSFYNPTRRTSFAVSGQMVEDVDGFYRKITAYPDDPIWRQSIVRRSMASIEGTGANEAIGNYPAHMTADQVADYLNIQVKTIRKWTSEGTIPYSKLGSMVRYKKEEIDAVIKDGSLKANTGESKKRKAASKVKRKSPRSS